MPTVMTVLPLQANCRDACTDDAACIQYDMRHNVWYQCCGDLPSGRFKASGKASAPSAGANEVLARGLEYRAARRAKVPAEDVVQAAVRGFAQRRARRGVLHHLRQKAQG